MTRPLPASDIAARSPAIPLPITRKSPPTLTGCYRIKAHCTMAVLPLEPSKEPVRVELEAGSRRSTILIGEGIAARLASLLDTHGIGPRRFVVSSPIIWRFHGEQLQ